MKSAFLHSPQEVIAELHERGFYADCSHLVSDSRRLGASDVFVALKGEKFDARSIADSLLDAEKCGLVLVEHDERISYTHASVVPVKGLVSMLGQIAAAYYGTQNLGLKAIAVTGTNGKTTTTRWLAQALTALGQKAGVIGTLGWGEPDNIRESFGLTTPDVLMSHQIIYRMASLGFKWVCVEASSIGLDQGRLVGVPFKAAIYTNLTLDHLDYHGSMEAYANAKAKLATWPGLQLAVTNYDDEYSRQFGELAKQAGCQSVSIGLAQEAAYPIGDIRMESGGINWKLAGLDVKSNLVGSFNVINASQVFACLVELGVAKPHQVATALAAVTPAPGRMEVVHQQPAVVIDYAHTPDALQKALVALRPMAHAKKGRLVVLFGCGGDRDPSKRPLMGQIAAELADLVYVTADNPRSESVAAINAQIMRGVSSAFVSKCRPIEDRGAAVMACLESLESNDVALLAGKGHETTQTIGDVVHPYSDAGAVKQALAKLSLAGVRQ